MVVQGASDADRGDLVGAADSLDDAYRIVDTSGAHRLTLSIRVAWVDRTPRGAVLAAGPVQRT